MGLDVYVEWWQQNDGDSSGGGGNAMSGFAGSIAAGFSTLTSGAVNSVVGGGGGDSTESMMTTGGGGVGASTTKETSVAFTAAQQFLRRLGLNSEVTRLAAVREWETKVLYNNNNNRRVSLSSIFEGSGALLDGRVFFATRKSYPVDVYYSTIKYEPKKVETLR
jgi:hypothetical protein